MRLSASCCSLILFLSFAEGIAGSRNNSSRRRIVLQPSAGDTPVHRLLEMAMFPRANSAESALPESVQSMANSGYYDDDSDLQSCDENEEAKEEDIGAEMDQSDLMAADVLLSMSGSRGAATLSPKEAKSDKRAHKAKRTPPSFKKTATTPKSRPKLKPLSDSTFLAAKVKNFSAYFDDRNISTVGVDYLLKCFHSSHFLQLAKFLIRKGARLPATEATFSGISATMSTVEESGISVSILMELVKIDPEASFKLFLEASKATEDKVSLDLFLVSILDDPETQAYLFSNGPASISILSDLLESGNFNGTVNFMVSNMTSPPERDQVIQMFGKALETGNFDFIEAILKGGWLDLTERIHMEDRQNLCPISHLFGKFDSEVIMKLIKDLGFNLNFTHDNNINPEGDILLIAMMKDDLKSFKRLLLAGASFNVRLSVKGDKLLSLEEYTRKKKPEYHAAIQFFKLGTLQDRLDD